VPATTDEAADEVPRNEVGAVGQGGIDSPDHPDDPDLPENRGLRPAEDPVGPPDLGTRIPLDRDRIISGAIDFIDSHGLPALTMRRLGTALGVEAMSLYRYVPGRDDLLDGVVDAVVDELFGDEDVFFEPRFGWQDYLQRLAHGVRRIALAHPALFPLVATRPPAAPWVRPPLRSLRWVESLLRALHTNGFTSVQAVVAYRAYTSFLLGHLLLEVAQRGIAMNAIDDPNGSSTARVSDLDAYPLIVELQPLLSLDETVTEFEEALESLLDRLTTMLDTGAHHLPPETLQDPAGA
jgi:AcrR family transcriptional regulator